MNIATLEARLAERPTSPLFVRLAGCLLESGEVQRAVELCQQGLKLFPDYATAHLILGRCYESLGRSVEAVLEYRRVLKAFPDNPHVGALLKRVEQREQEAFKAFAEERARKLVERRGSVSFESYVTDAVPGSRKVADGSGKQSEESSPRGLVPAKSDDEEEPARSGPAKIVTATLAEIYAAQGEYAAAIDAYKRLLAERPVDAERYQKRVAELEQLSRLQQTAPRS